MDSVGDGGIGEGVNVGKGTVGDGKVGRTVAGDGEI